MKFKADLDAFKAENALADIVVISRFAERKLEIEEDGRSVVGRYLRSEVVTDDIGLSGVLGCFVAERVRDVEGEQKVRDDMRVDIEALLTDLAPDHKQQEDEAASEPRREESSGRGNCVERVPWWPEPTFAAERPRCRSERGRSEPVVQAGLLGDRRGPAGPRRAVLL